MNYMEVIILQRPNFSAQLEHRCLHYIP